MGISRILPRSGARPEHVDDDREPEHDVETDVEPRLHAVSLSPKPRRRRALT